MDAPKPELAPEFDREAAPPPARVTVSLELLSENGENLLS
jgi:hypothetical protein